MEERSHVPRPALRTLVPYVLGVLIAGFLPILSLLDLADWADLPYRWCWILLFMENGCACSEVGLGVSVRGDLCVWDVPSEGCDDFAHSSGPL